MDVNINSVNYTSYGIPYSRVCGRIVAYEFGTPDGFLGYTNQNQLTIDDPYVDGISITFSHPRNHIWTFATTYDSHISGSSFVTPPFINKDYFCERGGTRDDNFIANNPLWDGQGCAGSSACCEFNNSPWFYKQLNQTVTEDMEIRIMSNANSYALLEDEDTPVQLIEIFVQ